MDASAGGGGRGGRGRDFACLGPALEVFSRYSRVEKTSGEVANAREYLEHVWAAVSTEALSMIFRDAETAGLEPDARLTAMWLWTVGGRSATNGKRRQPPTIPRRRRREDASEVEEVAGGKGKNIGYMLEFDAARKIAQGLGIHLEKSESIVEVKGETARLLPVAERTQYLFGKEAAAGATGRARARRRPSKRRSSRNWGRPKRPRPVGQNSRARRPAPRYSTVCIRP